MDTDPKPEPGREFAHLIRSRSKTTLAAKLEISRMYLSYIEKGQRTPSDRVVCKLVEVLKVPEVRLRKMLRNDREHFKSQK